MIGGARTIQQQKHISPKPKPPPPQPPPPPPPPEQQQQQQQKQQKQQQQQQQQKQPGLTRHLVFTQFGLQFFEDGHATFGATVT